jgi:hypothetical protein
MRLPQMMKAGLWLNLAGILVIGDDAIVLRVVIGDEVLGLLEGDFECAEPRAKPDALQVRLIVDEYAFDISSQRGRELFTPDELDPLEWDPRSAVCVVMASQGYPGDYRKGDEISGLAEASRIDDLFVFHAGTKVDERDRVVTDGGRVLGVTALGDDLAAAKARAYEAVKLISFAGMHYRTDIADKALKAKPPHPPRSRPNSPRNSADRMRAARNRPRRVERQQVMR